MRGPDLHDPNRSTVDPVRPVVVTPSGVDPKLAEQIREDAYRAGVADERGRHKRNPLVSILIALLAVLGLVLVVLYFVNGMSFSGAGRTLDEAASTAGDQAAVAGREVADETGEGLQDAGRTIEQRAGQAPSTGAPAASPEPAPTN